MNKPDPVMHTDRVPMPDGRYLIYYTFDGLGADVLNDTCVEDVVRESSDAPADERE